MASPTWLSRPWLPCATLTAAARALCGRLLLCAAACSSSEPAPGGSGSGSGGGGGAGGDEELIQFLCTLGVKRVDGTQKPAWETIRGAAAARGF